METKVCTTCKEEKDVSLFYKRKESKDGFHCMCKLCISKSGGRYRKLNLEKIKTRNAVKYKNNKESVRKKQKEYREKNKVRLLAIDKIKRDKERLDFVEVEKKRKYNKEYREKNKEIIRLQVLEYRKNNKEKVSAIDRLSRSKNKEKKKEIDRKYRLKNRDRLLKERV